MPARIISTSSKLSHFASCMCPCRGRSLCARIKLNPLFKTLTIICKPQSTVILVLCHQCFDIIPRPFLFELFPEYYILSNDDASRYFICLPIEDRVLSLAGIVNKVNRTMENFRQPLYYDVSYLNTLIPISVI